MQWNAQSDDIQKSHVDHSVAPLEHGSGGRVTWVKSQWKLRALPGQFCVEINTLLARRMVLAEDHLALGTMLGPPEAHAALERPSRRHQVAVRVAPLHLFQHSDRLQAGL